VETELEAAEPEWVDPVETELEAAEPEWVDPVEPEPKRAKTTIADLLKAEAEVAAPEASRPEVVGPIEAEQELAEPEPADTEEPEPETSEPEAAEPEAAQPEAVGLEDTEPEAPEPAAADPADKRSYERVKVAYEIHIEASLSLGGHEVMRLEQTGTTFDISRGGMMVRVKQDVLPGARCDVHFVDPKAKIEPARITGRVRRSSKVRDAFNLALEFDQPLARLDA
jgi:hypothetical protein